MSFKRGKPTGPLKKIGAARGTGTDRLFPSRSDDFSEDRVRPGVDSRAARDRQLHPQGRSRHVRERGRGDEGGLPAPGGPVRLRQKIVAERGAKPVHEARVRARTRERAAARPRAAVDRGDRRARAQLRQRHSDRIRRHARERTAGGHRQGRAQLHRHAQPVAERRDARRRGHPRRADRRPQPVHRGAAVPGADEGSTEQSRGPVGDRFRRPARRSSTGSITTAPSRNRSSAASFSPRGRARRAARRRRRSRGRRRRPAGSTCRAS